MKLVTLGIIVAIVTFVFVVVAQTVSVSPAVTLANCAAANDYSYSQLSSPPTTISCTTAQQSNSGLTASGCTIK